jgi:hypothetical protein
MATGPETWWDIWLPKEETIAEMTVWDGIITAFGPAHLTINAEGRRREGENPNTDQISREGIRVVLSDNIPNDRVYLLNHSTTFDSFNRMINTTTRLDSI